MADIIFEKIVEDYFVSKGYFTRRNVKYRPNGTGEHSDIDVLGINPTKKGANRVIVVNCKSFRSGISLKRTISVFEKNEKFKKVNGGYPYHRFREFIEDEWSLALRKEVMALTSEKKFTLYLAALFFSDRDKNQAMDSWKNFKKFQKNLQDCRIELIDMREMVCHLLTLLKDGRYEATPSDIESLRFLQLLTWGKCSVSDGGCSGC